MARAYPGSPIQGIRAARFRTVWILCGTELAVALLGGDPGPYLALYAAPLASLGAASVPWRRLAAASDEVVGVAVRGARVDLLTGKDAPNFKVVETRAAAPAFDTARAVVPQGSGVLTGLALASDGLYVARRDGATATLLRLADQAALPETVIVPFAGPVAGASGLIADPARPGADIGVESWLQPLVWLHYDPRARQVADLGIVPAFSRSLRAYQASETTVTARDGAPVALTIMGRRDAPRDHQRPVLLVADAGPGRFNPLILPWLDAGGLYAVAQVGGGDTGAFIDCARALLDRRLTDRAHLAGGGPAPILAAILKRPDLFRAALTGGQGAFQGAFQGALQAGSSGAEAADAQAFLLWQMGEPDHQPLGD